MRTAADSAARTGLTSSPRQAMRGALWTHSPSGRKDQAGRYKAIGGSLGSGADEGRAKLRYAPGRRKEPLNRGLLNGTSCPLTLASREGTCRIEAS
jgi:hypothetical protein